ncbi:tRNA dihydrouridine(20/20a) synthase DusA [Natronospira sp.]|uniref:tRNA dihydrouridine(20/20a) synthase DusA n=1 Tax=Natronospira sp. TaxID=2024970 RepID=UPI003873522E
MHMPETDNFKPLDRRLSVAPMMEWTDRHFRYFLRLISRQTLLYTEMVHARAVVNGDRERLLGFSGCEHPLALQLGGSEASVLADAAAIAQEWGYDEVNLNVGCPSDRVQSGRFGACLMREPDTVAACVAAMQDRVDIPVTIKCRIGVDEQDSDQALAAFVDTVSRAGCRHFIVHARKAWLKGLSPKENREKPPLNYERVERLAAEFPGLEIAINGGIGGLDQAEAFLKQFHGVMIGRAACSNPWLLAEAGGRIFKRNTAPESRTAVALAYADYCADMHQAGVPRSMLLRNIHGLFQGVPGARQWRRTLSESMSGKLAPDAIIHRALDAVPATDAA